MTVEELREKLKDLPGDLPVVVWNHSWDEYEEPTIAGVINMGTKRKPVMVVHIIA